MVPPARAVHPHKAGILGRSAPRPEVTVPPATHAAGETGRDRPFPSQASKGQNSILRESHCRLKKKKKKKSFKRQSFTKGETSTAIPLQAWHFNGNKAQCHSATLLLTSQPCHSDKSWANSRRVPCVNKAPGNHASAMVPLLS